ncbi:hypothetical protein FA13DRAFT_1789942 [Coprinellus micaceus]|uniref:DUF6533 domain-containing protein n=1 Tax=Coprinellus micaceus TaxID=71717 RepID=A0A4Y7THW2_COPMI|nr:hypothetical protein FA13DRAFT_1789942 [Coprinellus micaceus]
MGTDVYSEYTDWTPLYEYFLLSCYCAYLYQYLTSAEEEVTTVWPRRWTAGKTLYIVTRYSSIAAIFLSGLTSFRTFLELEMGACRGLIALGIVMNRISVEAADAAIALCLYAVLGSKKRYLSLVIGALIFTSIAVLALELTPLTAGVTRDVDLPGEMGYACLFSIGGYTPYKKWVAYISLIRTAVATLVGFSTLFGRYHGEVRPLVRTLQYNGIAYLSLRFGLDVSLLSTCDSGITLPMRPLQIVALPFIFFYGLSALAIPACSSYMLANLIKEAEDPGISYITISSIQFATSNETSTPDTSVGLVPTERLPSEGVTAAPLFGDVHGSAQIHLEKL